MKKLFAALQRAPKRTAGLLMVAAAIIVPVVLWAWGPERPTYTYANPAPHVTFNSITDNPKVGDERNFVRIREAVSGTNFRDDIQLQAGKTYEVMVFYHNNAATNLNDKIGTDGKPIGVARDVMARVQMPGRLAAGETATITGFINSSNATPREVWDNARAKSDSAVALRYVPNSAKIASSNGAVNGAALSSDLLTSGVKLGFDSLNGVLPGCNKYSGYITFRFTVDKPDFTLQKQVSVDNGKTWVDSARTTPGSTVQYRLVYTNTGTMQQDNVILKDQLPAGVTYVPGSSLLANSKTGGQYVKASDGVTTAGGYNIGSYAPGANAYFKFSAKMPAAKVVTLPAGSTATTCGDTTLTNKGFVFTENGSKSDTADVAVPNECKPTPVYTCDQLSVTKLSRTKVQFATQYTVSNATFKHVTYVVKNAAGTEVSRSTDTTFSTETVGAYTVQAIVTVTVDGVDKTATGANCTKPFEITKQPTPGVSIDKKVDGVEHKKVAVGQEFTYQLVVKNTGDTALTNAIVTDNAPQHVQFISADKGLIENNKWKLLIPDLGIGQSISINIKAKVTKQVDGTIKNTACVDAPQIPGTPDDCDDATVEVPPVPEVPTIDVCDLTSKKVITIKENQFDASKHSKNLNDCAEKPVTPETPRELPTTGAGEGITAIFGLGAIVASASYYIASRRGLGL